MRRSRVLALLPLCLCLSPLQADSATPLRPGPDAAAVVREMNTARQHPDVYAGYLEKLRGKFQGKIFILPNGRMLRTQEGVGAVDEAIRFLRHARPLPALAFSPGIAKAAGRHVAEQADGSVGHRGAGFSNGGDRMNRYGTWHTLWGEDIAYGKSTARGIVLALIIDDGLRGRKHRKNIFNSAFNYAGAAVGPHARYRTVCSIDFAAGYVEADASSLARVAHN